MRAFEYVEAATKEKAIEALSGTWDTVLLAGGTDLLNLMKDDVERPRRLVNIKGIPELARISTAKDGLHIGAAVTLDAVSNHAGIQKQYRALAAAAGEVAGPQIRHMATVGGNLCQRPRCWYYRNGFGLLARGPAGNYLVPEGDNRYHAILGTGGPAYFVHPSSLAPALIAFDAKLKIYGPKGSRDVALKDFYRIPKSDGERENLLDPNEIILEIVVPPSTAASAHYEVRQKEAMDWPLATACATLKMDAGRKVREARVVLGHVAPVPWVAAQAEKWLVGQTLSAETAARAGEAAVEGARALKQNGYKIRLAQVAVKRALLRAAGMEA